jgi:RND superfamily putative drug exporter
MGETTLPDERKRIAGPSPEPAQQPEEALVGAVATSPAPASSPRQPVAIPVEEAPTTRFQSATAREERDIGSWLGELRRKTSAKRPTESVPAADSSAEPTAVLPSNEPTHVIAAPEDATMAIPTASVADALSAEETRAIPVSRPAGDSEAATEKLNARGQNGGVSAQDLLRREGRI